MEKLSYLSDINHQKLLEHFQEGYFRDLFLLFTKEWMEKCLPKDSSNSLRVILLDTNNNNRYEINNFYAAYKEADYYVLLDKNYNEIKDNNFYTLSNYFYGEHYCPCNRKLDASRLGAITDDKCEGNRFLIEKITPMNSDIILMSETIPLEELEKTLV